MDIQSLIWLVPAAGVLALVFAFIRSAWITKQDPGDAVMVEIAGMIRDGAMAFLRRQYKTLAIFVLIVAGLLLFANKGDNRWIAVAFVVGAFASGLAGFFGMRVATLANTRTTAAARHGLPQALAVAFTGGSVMGMSVVGLALLGLGGLYLLFTGLIESSQISGMTVVLQVLTGFSMGASSIALFARVGGGIYTKAADVGADLVGKVEAGLPEDDPRNPAVIADNVGDNVGDVAGMGADLFESYIGAVPSTDAAQLTAPSSVRWCSAWHSNPRMPPATASKPSCCRWCWPRSASSVRSSAPSSSRPRKAATRNSRSTSDRSAPRARWPSLPTSSPRRCGRRPA